MKVFVFALILILVAMLFGISSWFGSAQMDIRDGGDAQVIGMDTDCASLDCSQVNLNNAQANQANAEGDAATTLANSEATVNYSSTLILWIVMILVVVTFSASWKYIK